MIEVGGSKHVLHDVMHEEAAEAAAAGAPDAVDLVQTARHLYLPVKGRPGGSKLPSR